MGLPRPSPDVMGPKAKTSNRGAFFITKKKKKIGIFYYKFLYNIVYKDVLFIYKTSK